MKRRLLLILLLNLGTSLCGNQTQIVQVQPSFHELSPETMSDSEPTIPLFTSPSLPPTEFSLQHVIPFKRDVDEPNLPAKDLEMPPTALLTLPTHSPFIDEKFADALINENGIPVGSDHFDVQVEYAPKQSRPGYVFKITLLPHQEVQFTRIRQNVYFLIDRSNSIPRKRYFLNKQAVARALDYLKPGDRFNILMFDNHIVRFSDEVVEHSENTVNKAQEFLDKQGHGGIFAATELYTSLDKIIPQNVSEDEINTVILLSDGDTYLSSEKQRLMIGGWTKRNMGKVTLYTVASGSGNNLPLLDLLSTFNKGALIYATEHQQIGDRLAYLMRSIQNPIGKEMIPTAITESKNMQVYLQPKIKRLPDLYQNRPFVLYGSTNRLHDFVLFLQGRCYNQHFDIKKTISFSDAKIGASSIEKGWIQLLVQEFYEHYFEEGKRAYLEGAKQLLTPFNLPTPLIN